MTNDNGKKMSTKQKIWKFSKPKIMELADHEFHGLHFSMYLQYYVANLLIICWFFTGNFEFSVS